MHFGAHVQPRHAGFFSPYFSPLFSPSFSPNFSTFFPFLPFFSSPPLFSSGPLVDASLALARPFPPPSPLCRLSSGGASQRRVGRASAPFVAPSSEEKRQGRGAPPPPPFPPQRRSSSPLPSSLLPPPTKANGPARRNEMPFHALRLSRSFPLTWRPAFSRPFSPGPWRARGP